MFRSAPLAAICLLSACATPGLDPQAGSPPPAPIEVPAIAHPAQENAAWWFRSGAASAHAKGAGQRNAKNIILFVGDGMSLTTVAAARILEGQRRGAPGEENRLSFENFPHTAFSRTYNVDSQTPDSAGTMSAMVTGAKTRMGVLSLSQQPARGDCAGSRGAALPTLLEFAEAAGLATGVVTTTRLTHATPAATFAHSPDRNWEVDADLPPAAVAEGCRDIAAQLLDFDIGDGPEVLLGGGRSQFFPAGSADPEYSEFVGARLDGRDLVQEWRRRHPGGTFAWNAKQLPSATGATTERLLGLFDPDHMQYEHERAGDRGGEPSLAQMTAEAIAVLRRNPDGFFLMVEGGRIDHAHHAGNAYRALSDTIAFSEAVRVAMQSTSEADTLILVTADHSHTLGFVGYPKRGNPILGKVSGGSGEDSRPGLAGDALGLPYTTLAYANGPGYAGASDQQPAGPKRYPHQGSGVLAAEGRPDLRHVDTEHPDYLQEAMVPGGSETHGGDDVGVWASGPGSAAVRGSLEQHEIFHVLLQAQPRMRALSCATSACEHGVPVRPSTVESVRAAGTRPGAASPQAR